MVNPSLYDFINLAGSPPQTPGEATVPTPLGVTDSSRKQLLDNFMRWMYQSQMQAGGGGTADRLPRAGV